jgi:hypothetical protein
MTKKRKPSPVANLAQGLFGTGESGKGIDFPQWVDGMMSIAGYMWHLQKADEAVIGSARNIDLLLSQAEKGMLVEQLTLAHDLKNRLREDGDLQVSLDELASIVRSLSPLMEAAKENQAVLQACLTCVSTFSEAIQAATKRPDDRKPKRRSRKPL